MLLINKYLDYLQATKYRNIRCICIKKLTKDGCLVIVKTFFFFLQTSSPISFWGQPPSFFTKFCSVSYHFMIYSHHSRIFLYLSDALRSAIFAHFTTHDFPRHMVIIPIQSNRLSLSLSCIVQLPVIYSVLILPILVTPPAHLSNHISVTCILCSLAYLTAQHFDP